jgi:hypothetical protein
MLAMLGKLLVLVFRVLLLPLRMVMWLEEVITGERRRLREERNKMEQRIPRADEEFVAQAGIPPQDVPVALATRKALARACCLPETVFYPDDGTALLRRLMTRGPDAHWLDLGPDWFEVLVDIGESLGLRSIWSELDVFLERWREAERSQDLSLRELVLLLAEFVHECRVPVFLRVERVSVWAGRLGSIDDAETYFTELIDGEARKPSPFANAWGLGFYPPNCLEIHFEQESARTMPALFQEASFSQSFIEAAVEAAGQQGVHETQGIALLYDFDYQLKPGGQPVVGSMRFLGSFAFDRGALAAKFHALAEKAGCSVAAVLFVLAAFGHCRRKRNEEKELSGHMSAAEFCEYLAAASVEDTVAIRSCLPSKHAAEVSAWAKPAKVLCRLGLPRSEDVGRVVFGLVNAGVLTRQESDSEADFQGRFVFD